MARGRSFSPIEEQLLLDNYDKTIAELDEILAAEGYKRSRKSINRKLEKMRDDGLVGFRSKDTIRRSYRQRARKRDKVEPTDFNSSFDSGESGFDSDDSGFDNGLDWDDVQ